MTRAFYSIVYDIVFLIERKINYFILFYFILFYFILFYFIYFLKTFFPCCLGAVGLVPAAAEGAPLCGDPAD
jgi:hypothetical protein